MFLIGIGFLFRLLNLGACGGGILLPKIGGLCCPRIALVSGYIRGDLNLRSAKDGKANRGWGKFTLLTSCLLEIFGMWTKGKFRELFGKCEFLDLPLSSSSESSPSSRADASILRLVFIWNKHLKWHFRFHFVISQSCVRIKFTRRENFMLFLTHARV